jgi:hypothetical protein
MAAQKDGGLVARSVREALGTLVSPQMYTQLVARALHMAGLNEIPEHGRAVGSWIQGELGREIENSVGADAVELVLEQLAPVIAHANAHAADKPAREAEAVRQPGPAAQLSDRAQARARRIDRSNDATARGPFASERPTGVIGGLKPTTENDQTKTARLKLTREQLDELHGRGASHTVRPVPPSQLRRVLVASSARGEIDALRGYLHGIGNIAEVADLVGLLDALDDTSLVDPIVLLDCQRPTVHVTSIAAIGEDLPPGTTIVLWGASDDSWKQVDRERTPNCKWVRCSHEATTGDVGSLCSMLIRQA